MHGNELVGIEAVRYFMGQVDSGDFRLERGRVDFVLANPRAIAGGVRYIEQDLNRLNLREPVVARSYEAGLALQLREIFDRAEVSLDLHASTLEDMKPFAICEGNASELVSYLYPGIVCSGFDEHEPGGTDYLMNLMGKKGICVESGYARAMEDVPEVKGMVYNLFKGLGMMPGEVTRYEEKTRYEVFSSYKPRGNFVLADEFASFAALEEGAVIGRDDGKVIKAERDCNIIFARSINNSGIGPNKEAYLLMREVQN